MPKRKRTTTKVTTVTKGRRRKRRTRRRARIPQAFPDRFVSKMKYVDFITLDMGATDSGIPKTYNFRANSIFDPDKSGVGHQPLGHDEMNIVYDHYCVIGSKIKCTFAPQGGQVVNVDMLYMLAVQDTPASHGNAIDYLEQNNTKGTTIAPGYAGSSKTLTAHYSPYKLFGLSKKDSLISNNKLNTSFGSNPTEDAIFQVGIVCPTATSANPSPIRVRVEIEYLVVCTERRPLNRS